MNIKPYLEKARERLEQHRGQAQAKYRPVTIVRVVEAILMALLLGILLALAAEPLGFIALLIGLPSFLILMLRSADENVHFRFGLIFGIEWLLLPLAVSITTHDANALVWGIKAGLLLELSIPLGIVQGLFFLFVAIVFFSPGLKVKE